LSPMGMIAVGRGVPASGLRLRAPNDARRRGRPCHGLPTLGRELARGREPRGHCADWLSTPAPAAKRCRRLEMRTAWAGLRRDRSWTRSKAARQSHRPQGRKGWKSCANRERLRAAFRTSDTRCRRSAPPIPGRGFRFCNADICEQPRLTSECERLQ
jgi:hypothetical protein